MNPRPHTPPPKKKIKQNKQITWIATYNITNRLKIKKQTNEVILLEVKNLF